MRAYVEKIEPRLMLLVMAGGLLLVCVLMASSLVIPKFKDFSAISKAETLLQSTARSGGELTALFASTNQNIEQLQKALHGEMANLPVQQLESFIIGRLQKISWQNRVDLVSVRPGKGEKVQNFKEILFDVELTGKYIDFFNWLQTLSKDLGFVVIKTFDIQPRANHEADPDLTVRLTMVSYRAVES